MSDVIITVDNRPLHVEEGTTVAAAMIGAGITTFRDSVTGHVRGPLCGMGTCFECRVTLDGVPHQRACMSVVKQGMVISTRANS